MHNIASPKRTKHWSADGCFLNLLMGASERWNGRVDPKTTSERGPTKSPVSVLSGFKYILKSNTVRSLLPRGTAATFKPSKRGLSAIRELDTFTVLHLNLRELPDCGEGLFLTVIPQVSGESGTCYWNPMNKMCCLEMSSLHRFQ